MVMGPLLNGNDRIVKNIEKLEVFSKYFCSIFEKEPSDIVIAYRGDDKLITIPTVTKLNSYYYR